MVTPAPLPHEPPPPLLSRLTRNVTPFYRYLKSVGWGRGALIDSSNKTKDRGLMPEGGGGIDLQLAKPLIKHGETILNSLLG